MRKQKIDHYLVINVVIIQVNNFTSRARLMGADVKGLQNSIHETCLDAWSKDRASQQNFGHDKGQLLGN